MTESKPSKVQPPEAVARAEKWISNGECAAQVEIENADLRESLVRNVAAGIREAQVQALEGVAKEICVWCAREKHMPPATTKPEWKGWAHYDPGRISRVCKVPGEVHDALAKLRSEGEK